MNHAKTKDEAADFLIFQAGQTTRQPRLGKAISALFWMDATLFVFLIGAQPRDLRVSVPPTLSQAAPAAAPARRRPSKTAKETPNGSPTAPAALIDLNARSRAVVLPPILPLEL